MWIVRKSHTCSLKLSILCALTIKKVGIQLDRRAFLKTLGLGVADVFLLFNAMAIGSRVSAASKEEKETEL